MPETNPRRQIATAEVQQRTKRLVVERKPARTGDVNLGPHNRKRTPGHQPPWLQTGNHVLGVDRVKSGEAEKYKIWALQRLVKDWSSYDLTIYTDGSAMNGTAIGGGGILITVGPQSSHTIHHSYATLAGTWCSPFQ